VLVLFGGDGAGNGPRVTASHDAWRRVRQGASEAVSLALAAAEHAAPRSAARGFAKKPAVRAARDPRPSSKSNPSGASRRGREGARTRAARETGRSERCAVKRIALLRGHVEDIERFESGARGVGRLLHTSGRRILSAGIGERREAFGGQTGQLRGELPPEDAGEKDPGRYKGARAARGNCKGNARDPRPLERRTYKPTRGALGPEPSFALNRRAEGTAPGEGELEARRKTGEGGRRGRRSSITRRSSSRQRAPEARYTRFAPPADEAQGVRGRRERSWHGRPCPRAAPGSPSRSRRG